MRLRIAATGAPDYGVFNDCLPAATPVLVSATFDGLTTPQATCRVRINGVAQTPDMRTISTVPGSPSDRLGASVSTDRFSGTLAALTLYGAVLTEAQIGAVEADLKARWGITAVGP